MQKLRIMMGNRIVGNFKAKLGQAPGESEKKLDADSQALLVKIRKANKLVTTGAVVELQPEHAEDEDALPDETLSPDAPPSLKKEKKLAKMIVELLERQYDAMTKSGEKFPTKTKFKGNPVISDYTELCLMAQYRDLETEEARHFSRLGNILQDFPIFTTFLDDIRGIGPAIAGVIISEIDITKARHPSSLWKYAGLDVAGDGKGRSRKAEHLVKARYVNRDGEEAERNSITFNPFLKTKLIGVLAPSFLRANNEKYRAVYDDYKNRLQHRPDWSEEKKGHINNAALRYTIKMFLIDLYAAWRTLEGLPVSKPYHEAKLGIKHAA